MAGKLPKALHLPSGRKVRLADGAAAKARSALPQDDEGPFAAALAILSAEGVLSGEGGEPLDVYTLPLRDVHTLRAFLTRAGHLPEAVEEFTCDNCDAPFEAAPSALLEVGPFLDGELSDPDLDAPFPFGEALPIPRIALPAARPSPRRFGSPARRPAAAARARSADTITFAERTAGDARALFRAADATLTGRTRSLRVTPGVVLGMGVVALGSERRAGVLADALAGAPGHAWAAVVAHFLDAAYPPRLFGVHRCEKCGARNDLDAPLDRELEREPLPREGSIAVALGKRPRFPGLDAFEALVREHADRIYAARGVKNVDLFVDADVPHCDEGGEPLLGSYLAGGVDEDTGVPRAPEVRLYYRTFQAEYARDPEFDLEAEIHETIDHELEHHLNHLSGTDPLDEDEHAAIDAEEIRRIGTREAARRGRQALVGSATGFLRTTWPMWMAVLIAMLIAWWSR